MDCSTPDFSVFHHLPELAETHVHWVGNAIQPSCPLSSSSPPAFSYFPASGSFPLSWLFASGGQSTGASVSVLPMNIQDWFPLGLTGFISSHLTTEPVYALPIQQFFLAARVTLKIMSLTWMVLGGPEQRTWDAFQGCLALMYHKIFGIIFRCFLFWTISDELLIFGACFFKLNTVTSQVSERSGELESRCPKQKADTCRAEVLSQHLPALLGQEKPEVHILYVVFLFGESHFFFFFFEIHILKKNTAGQTEWKCIGYLDYKRRASLLDRWTTAFRFTYLYFFFRLQLVKWHLCLDIS